MCCLLFTRISKKKRMLREGSIEDFIFYKKFVCSFVEDVRRIFHSFQIMNDI